MEETIHTPEQLIAAIDDAVTNHQPLPMEILHDIRAEIAKTIPPHPGYASTKPRSRPAMEILQACYE